MRAYWKQQKGYGKAEAMLEHKWPEKYNVAGHAIWSGRIYANGLTYLGWRARRVYHGQWGMAPFQSLYEPAPSPLESLPMMPEWYLILLTLGAFSALAPIWKPFWLALPLLILAGGISLVQAVRSARGASFEASLPPRERRKRRSLTALLFLMQPLARLLGRLRHGLIFWRQRAMREYALPRPWTADLWTHDARPVEEWLESFEAALKKPGWVTARGGEFSRWDLEARCGLFGSARMRMALEHHGSGRELLRINCRPVCSTIGAAVFSLFALLDYAATADGEPGVGLAFGGLALLTFVRIFQECAAATAVFLAVVRKIKRIEGGAAKSPLKLQTHPA